MSSPVAPEFYHAPALPLTEAELRVLLELQSIGTQTSFANVLRAALWHYSLFHGLRLPADIWTQR